MNINKKNKMILIYLLIIPFFMPSVLSLIPGADKVVEAYQVLIGIFIVFLSYKRRKISKFLLFLSMFYVAIGVSAFLHNTITLGWIRSIVFLWLVYFFTLDEYDRDCFFKVYLTLETIMILINLGTMIVFPEGMFKSGLYNTNWFLGYKNALIRRIIPFIAIMLVSNREKKMQLNKKQIFMIVICILTILLSLSINSMIGLVAFLSIIILRKKGNKLVNRIKLINGFVIYVILNCIILLIDARSFFQTIILNLGKNASASGRFSIWSQAISLFEKSPLIGYGTIGPNMFNLSFGTITHPHNLLLHYLLLGGVICWIIIIIAFKWCDKKMEKNNPYDDMKKSNDVFIAFYVSIYIMGFVESLTAMTWLFPMMVLLYNMNVYTAGRHRV